MNRLTGHGRAKYTTGTRLGTSEGRGWRGLLAERWQHSEGDLAEIQPRDTEVIVMLQGRLRVRRRGDGRLQHHDAVPGTVWLCPAGIREDMIHLYGDVKESIHLYLPAAPLSETALREFDVDPDKVRLRYDGGFRDPLVENIAREIHAEMIGEAPLGRMQVETLAKALGVYIMRHYSNLEPASTSLPAVRGALDARRLERIKEFIDVHISEDLTIDTLARRGLPQPVPLRPRLQGGDRLGATPLHHGPPHRARKGAHRRRPAPARGHRLHLRVLVPGPPHPLVQAHRRRHPRSVIDEHYSEKHFGHRTSIVGFSSWEKIFFVATLIAVSLWVVLVGIAARNLLELEFITITASILFALSFYGFGIAGPDRIPIRRFIKSWASDRSRFRWRRALTIVVLAVGVWESLGIIHCYFRHAQYFDLLETARNEQRDPIASSVALGRAFGSFPNRPETYIAYNKIRQYLKDKEKNDARLSLNAFASQFLINSANLDVWNWCPIFFCCSCLGEDHYHLLRNVAHVEIGDLLSATDLEPAEQEVHDYLLWLYHMSERTDLSPDEKQSVRTKMDVVVNDTSYHSSPVYPLVLDHLFQMEQENSNCREGATIELLKGYTQNFIAYYNSVGKSDPISPPNKTFVYYLIRRVSEGYKSRVYSKLDYEVSVVLAKCEDFRTFLHEIHDLEGVSARLADLTDASLDVDGSFDLGEYLEAQRHDHWLLVRKQWGEW